MARQRRAVSYDALIIGAGPAGATAALVLAKAGWSVAIVERAAFPRRKVCGEFISATSLPLLHELGVAQEFLARAGPEVRRVGLFAGEEILSAAMPTGAGAACGRALGREHLDLTMLDAAVRAGATLWQPWSAVALTPTRAGRTCTVAAKDRTRELLARAVILAHGSWEPGRLPSQAARPHRASDLLAFKAHFTGSALAADLMPLLVFPGGYGGMVHSDGGRVTLSCCIRRDVLQRCRAQAAGVPAGDAVLRHIFASCAGVRDALARAQRVGAWLSAGPIRPGIRPRHADGAFFAGNSAGEAHPIVAEGISMAMQSAWLLARAFAARGTEPQGGHAAAARDYAVAWAKHFAPRVRAASVFAHVAMRPDKARPLLPLIRTFPAILTLGARLSGKITQVVAAA